MYCYLPAAERREPLLDPDGDSCQASSDCQETRPGPGGEQAPRGGSARRPTCTTLQLALAFCAALVLALCVMLAGARSGGRRCPPYCRKSSSIAILTLPPCHTTPAQTASPSGEPCEGGDGDGMHQQQLLLWSGIGLHKRIFGELLSFDLRQRVWRHLRPAPGPHPVPRWKAGTAQAAAGGMVVVGGDAYTPNTRLHSYSNDVWRLAPTPAGHWTWEQAVVAPGAQPAPRRGHSTIHYKVGMERSGLAGCADGANRLLGADGRNVLTPGRRHFTHPPTTLLAPPRWHRARMWRSTSFCLAGAPRTRRCSTMPGCLACAGPTPPGTSWRRSCPPATARPLPAEATPPSWCQAAMAARHTWWGAVEPVCRLFGSHASSGLRCRRRRNCIAVAAAAAAVASP